MKIELNVKIDNDGICNALGVDNHYFDRIEYKLDKILRQQGVMMATVAELNAELSEINATTDELAADVAELITKMDNPAALDEVKVGLTAIKDKLKGVASAYPVTPPVDPPVDPATGQVRRR